MSWSSSSRKQRFNKGWATVRKRVLERDQYRCQMLLFDSDGFCIGVCGRPANEVDHIQRDGVRDDDRYSNLRALCHECHARKTAVESVKGKIAKQRKRADDVFLNRPAFK